MIPCRSRLAGEGVLEHCANLKALFAGKPAPTKSLSGMIPCRSRLAGEGVLEQR
jgi:hypothetical protein